MQWIVDHVAFDGGGIFWDVLGKVSHGVEHGLFVKFVRDPTDDDWRIDEIVGPIGTTLFIQGQVPVGPARNPMIEILFKF